MSNVDVELLYGVSGGGDLNGASGREISKSLKRLVSNLSKAKIPTVKIYFDDSDLKNKLKDLKNRITKALGEAGKTTINISGEGGKKGTRANTQSAYLQKQAETLKALSKEVDNAYKSQEKFYKNHNTNTEKYTQDNIKQAQAVSDLSNKIQTSGLAKKRQAELEKQIGASEVNNQAVLRKEYDKTRIQYEKLVENTQMYIQRMEKQGVASKEAKDKLALLKEEMKAQVPVGKDMATNLDNLKQKYDSLINLRFETSSSIAQSGAADPTVWTKFVKALTNKFQSMLSAVLITAAARALRQVYQNVLSIDTSLTQLNITARLTKNQMAEFLDNTYESATRLGVEINDLVDSVTEFVRLGYSLSDSSMFAELTAMYSKVTGISVDETTTNMVALIKAFNVSASEAELVLDKMITVGNNYAISPGELGEAMNNAASSLAANGNTLEEAMGILTAANTTLQNINKSSTAVRTIAARISASTLELEALGEDSTGVLATADLDEKMRALGVAIVDANGDLRSTYDILNDLAAIWDELQTTERAAVAEMLAGTRQQNAFYSIMDNWEDAIGAVEDSERAAGTLTSSYDIYMDSIEGRIGQLQATWQEFSANILDSEVVKVFITIAESVAKALNGVLKFADGFMGDVMIVVGGIAVLTVALTVFKTKFKLHMEEIKASLKSTFTFSNTFIGLALMVLAKLSSSSNKTATIIVAALLLIGATVVIVIKMIDAGIKSFMATNPIGWILLALSALITMIMAIYDLIKQHNPTYDDMKEAAKEAADAWKEAKEELEAVETELENINNQIKELKGQGTLSLVDEQQLKVLEQEAAILESELATAQANAAKKEKEAAEAMFTAMSKYQNTKDNQHAWWEYALAWGIGGVFGAIPHHIMKKEDEAEPTKQEKSESILKNWQYASDSDKSYVLGYITEIQGLIGDLSYQTGENLEGWQHQLNAYLDDYYKLLDQYNFGQGKSEAAWESIFSRLKFEDATKKLSDLTNAFELNAETLAELYRTDSDIKEFIDYLIEIGVVAGTTAVELESLKNQLWEMRVGTVVNSKDYFTILDSLTDRYDTLSDAIEEMEENGVLSGETMNNIIKDFAEWKTQIESLEKSLDELNQKKLDAEESGDTEKVADIIKEIAEVEETIAKLKANVGFSLTEDGYILNDNAMDEWINDIKEQYQEAIDAAQEYYDKIYNASQNGYATEEELKNAQEALDAAKENYENMLVVLNTLERSAILEEYTEKLKEHSDALEDSLDKYKDIIDARKDLLQSYADEVEYQKTLAQKTKAVADLETRLALAKLDTSASGKATVRELESELADAEEDLSAYTLDKAISDLESILESEYDEYEAMINNQVALITQAIDNAAKQTTDALREAINNGTVPKYHSGGFVGGVRSNEEFAKLMEGEFVATPKQMSNFMNRTLPGITSKNGVNYNAPLIEINCDNITQDAMPQLEKVVDKAVKQIKDEINGTFDRKGIKKPGIDKFKI